VDATGRPILCDTCIECKQPTPPATGPCLCLDSILDYVTVNFGSNRFGNNEPWCVGSTGQGDDAWCDCVGILQGTTIECPYRPDLSGGQTCVYSIALGCCPSPPAPVVWGYVSVTIICNAVGGPTINVTLSSGIGTDSSDSYQWSKQFSPGAKLTLPMNGIPFFSYYSPGAYISCYITNYPYLPVNVGT